MNFSQNLKNFRKEFGLSAKELANRLNLTTNMIYEWEHGRATPSIDALIELSKIFKITIGQLVGIEDDFGNVVGQSTLTKDEQRLIVAFEKLNGDFKEKVIEFAELCAGIDVVKK